MKALALALLLALPLPANAACRLALAFALDVSGSVDQSEYQLQMSGLAAALGDPDVRDALFAMPEAPVAMAIFEWSSSSYQRLVQDWIIVTSDAELDAIRTRLLAWKREAAPEATGLGAAMAYGKWLLDRAPECWDRTLDISGDGKNNDWPRPERLRAQGRLFGIRINGLVVAGDYGGGNEGAPLEAGELSAYFLARIIQGPDAFIEVALGFDTYAKAMRRKLLRELATRPVGQNTRPASPIRRVAAIQ